MGKKQLVATITAVILVIFLFSMQMTAKPSPPREQPSIEYQIPPTINHMWAP